MFLIIAKYSQNSERLGMHRRWCFTCVENLLQSVSSTPTISIHDTIPWTLVGSKCSGWWGFDWCSSWRWWRWWATVKHTPECYLMRQSNHSHTTMIRGQPSALKSKDSTWWNNFYHRWIDSQIKPKISHHSSPVPSANSPRQIQSCESAWRRWPQASCTKSR